MTPEARGIEFLDFVARNASRLKLNLRKNILYDPEYFDDVFGYTVLRVYDSILNRGLDIRDYEQYFFNASRLNYIKMRERGEKRRQREIPESICSSSLRNEMEPQDSPAMSDLEEVREELEDMFGAEEAGIFLRYMKAKTEDRISYRAFALREGLAEGRVTEICSRIKRYMRN